MTVFQELVGVGIVQILLLAFIALMLICILVAVSKGREWSEMAKEMRHHRECLLAIQEQTGNTYRVLYETYNGRGPAAEAEAPNGGTVNVHPQDVGR